MFAMPLGRIIRMLVSVLGLGALVACQTTTSKTQCCGTAVYVSSGLPSHASKAPKAPLHKKTSRKKSVRQHVQKQRVNSATRQAKAHILNDMTFDISRATIKKRFYPTLNQYIALLNASPKARIDIAGYTSNTGTMTFNDKLSLRRALRVKRYFMNHGISKNRIHISSHGEKNPVASNKTAQGRTLNRRVELTLQSVKSQKRNSLS